MSRLTPEEILKTYPVGTIVRVRQDTLETWQPAVASKLKDRLGTVATHTYPNKNPIVSFLAQGRRKEFRIQINPPERYLDIITDEAEIKEWRDEVAATAERKAKRIAKRTTA